MQGIQGTTGSQGASGAQGVTGIQGAIGPQGAPGVQGFFIPESKVDTDYDFGAISEIDPLEDLK